MDSITDDMLGDVSDKALEAELAALLSGSTAAMPKGKVGGSKKLTNSTHCAAGVSKLSDAQSDMSDVDEDDAELMAELMSLSREQHVSVTSSAGTDNCERLSPVGDMTALLQQRLQMYRLAETNAKIAGETSRARRYARGVKTLEQLMTRVTRGQPVCEDDVPPAIAVSSCQPAHESPAPAPEEDQQANCPVNPAAISTAAISPSTVAISTAAISTAAISTAAISTAAISTAAISPSTAAISTAAISTAAISTAAISPSTAAISPSTAAISPSTAAISPSTAAISPSTAAISPSTAAISPSTAAISPSTAAISTAAISPSTAAISPSTANSIVCHPRLQEVRMRRDEFKRAAFDAKQANDKEKAVQCIQIIKAFDQVLNEMQTGAPVDLSDMPDSPSIFFSSGNSDLLLSGGPNAETTSDTSSSPVTIRPQSVLQCLEQRLTFYQNGETAAREAADASKARRYGRICKQYRDAIKLHSAGRPVDFDQLPTPHGYPEIGDIERTNESPSAAKMVSDATNEASPATALPASPSPGTKPTSSTRAGQRSRSEQQKIILDAQRRLFVEAARKAKQSGDAATAREHLRQAKRLERLIEAASQGLPINMATLPVPPQRLKASASQLPDCKVVCSRVAGAVDEMAQSADSHQLYLTLRKDLLRQIQLCRDNSRHYKLLADVAQSNSFEQLAQRCARDLHAVEQCFSSSSSSAGGSVANEGCQFAPKFHYETRQFRIVQACTDLNGDQLELCIIQGVSYMVPNPREVDTYVKWEFPWPSDNVSTGRTVTVKNTNNPNYNDKCLVTIDRLSRAMLRVFRRASVKCEVWQRGRLFGWTDQLIGTAQIKLEDLCTRCIVHNSHDVMQGRRNVKGKLEVRLRVRTPLVSAHVENVNEKWLVIDKA